MRRAIVSAFIVLGALSVARTAYADPESEAQLLFTRGRELRTKGDCANAVPLFAEAYRVFPSGLGSMRNVAECEETLGHYAAARRAWRNIQAALMVQAPGAKYRGWDEQAQDAVTRLKKKVGSVIVRVALKTPTGDREADEKSGVELSVNGEKIDTTFPETPLERDPGNYRIRVQAPNAKPVDQEVVLAAGDAKQVTITVVQTSEAATPAGPPVAPAEPSGRLSTATIATGIFALAAAGGGAALGIVALSAQSDFEDDPTTVRADSAERAALRANMCFGLALTLGVTTVVLLMNDLSDASKGTASRGRSLQVRF